jgi:hypothetical protein
MSSPQPTKPSARGRSETLLLETRWKPEVATNGERLMGRWLSYGQSATDGGSRRLPGLLCKPEVTGSIPVRSIRGNPERVFQTWSPSEGIVAGL